jgi:hypothetical protein
LFSIEAAAVPGWLVDDVTLTVSTVVPSVVRVTNNLSQGNFVLNGPGFRRLGQGLLNIYSNVPPGPYTVTFGAVQFYQTPQNQTQSLAEGGTIVLQGNYTFSDANNNGMSDTWEQQYFGSVSPGRTQNTDTDSDSATDFEEFIAGTNPADIASYLKVLTPQLIGPNLRITWPSTFGRLYRLEGSSNGITWSPLSGWIRARAAFTSATLSAQGPLPSMFRVEVRP